MINEVTTERKTVIRFNEADGYFEVQHGEGQPRRFPEKELAVIVAHEYGRPVELVAWDDDDAAWARCTLNILAGMAAQRDSKPYRPSRRTRAHLNRIERAER